MYGIMYLNNYYLYIFTMFYFLILENIDLLFIYFALCYFLTMTGVYEVQVGSQNR